MKLHRLNKVLSDPSPELEAEVRLSMDILDRINELLNVKFDGKQKLLADKLGKSEAEVSKWLNGVQNFTIKTLSKLSTAFGEPIIAACTNNERDSIFIQVKIPYNTQHTKLVINQGGKIKEIESITFKKIRNQKSVQSKNTNYPMPA